MGPYDMMGCNGHNSLKFGQFNKTVGVNNENYSFIVNNVNNRMPVVVNNDIYVNSHGGGKNFDVNSHVCHDIKAMDTVSHVNLTACDSNALIVDCDQVFDSINNFVSQDGSPPGTIIDCMVANPQTVPRDQHVYSYHGSVHKIDRFNDTFVYQLDNSHNQFVYIHNYPQNKPGGFYILKFTYQTGQMTILDCVSHPVDVLQVCDSIWLCVYPTISEPSVLHTKQQAKLAYDNYKKDCLSNQR